jgi:hypothetical protein
VDWKVEVDQKREREPAGWFQDAAGEWKPRPKRSPDEPRAEEDALGWEVEVMVRRKGTLLLPVKLELRYEGGASETLLWSREEQARSTWWKPLEGRAPSKHKLLAAILDPERVITLDLDLSDNQWYDATDDATPLRWAERAFTQYSHLLHGLGGIGG